MQTIEQWDKQYGKGYRLARFFLAVTEIADRLSGTEDGGYTDPELTQVYDAARDALLRQLGACNLPKEPTAESNMAAHCVICGERLGAHSDSDLCPTGTGSTFQVERRAAAA